jgi:hypothetical protein
MGVRLFPQQGTRRFFLFPLLSEREVDAMDTNGVNLFAASKQPTKKVGTTPE